EWKGSFYPADLAADGMLSYYAGRLPSVEINNTFYRLPRESVIEGWAAQVPDTFRFVIKASRRITHFKRLKGAEEETGYLLRTVGLLGERLGAVLFQLPPNMKQDLERLDVFLSSLGDPGRAAFEFRHASWFDEGTYDCLRAHGAALCTADTDEEDAEITSTAHWGYLRLRKADYPDDSLADWARRVHEAGWDRAFVFFKHEDDGAGPEMAERFLALCDDH
ncbi:MAG: DUF72 domain-containing protein, partial [marine benthic group bacterium]|nr:DUF72 domain-containing protein [Candidatus Benthicola marisminoris]